MSKTLFESELCYIFDKSTMAYQYDFGASIVNNSRKIC